MSGAITNSSCVDHIRARIRETTAVQNLQSQVSKLRKKVASAEEAEKYLRVMVDNQKDVEKDMRSQQSAVGVLRVGAEIKRRKVEKEVSRLKGKIKAIFEADCEGATEELDSTGGGRCDVEDNSGDDAEELPHRRLYQRGRPSGLSYYLRHAATRATMRRYLKRKADELE
jgi:TolA-binding protein